MKHLIMTVLLIAVSLSVFAQHKVNGKVTDPSGEPIIGANIIIKGTTTGTITDLDGKYGLENIPDKAILAFSFIGYESQEFTINSSMTLNVTLQEDNTELEQVVVIGYGTQRKGDVTSAVASVKADEFTDGKVSDAAGLIKGKVAGLSIVNSSGNPTETSSIMLRGITTITGNVSPLILIDGVEGSLNDVASENIASIDVLKDASAAAIYGTRGANGVIIITTKTGKREQKLSAVYNGYVSFSNWAKKADFMGVNDIVYGKTTFTDEFGDTDWLSEISNDYGFTQNHSLTITGGSAKSTYSGNISYNDEEGMIKNSGNENIKVQTDLTHYALNDIIKFNINTLVRQQNYDINDNSYVYRQAIIRNPTSSIYNEDGSYNENFNKLYYYNPVAMLNEYSGDGRYRSFRLTGNVTVEPIKGWQTNLMVSRSEGTSVSQTYTSKKHYSLVQKDDYNGAASKSEGGDRQDNIEITSKYDKTIGKHRFNVLVGYSYLYSVYDGFSANNGNFPSEAYLYNNLGRGSLLTEKDRHAGMSSYKNDNTLVGFFGRISYAFNDRYNLLVSVRREGSSKFGKDNKWGTFPSISAGWTISKESFMSDISWLDNLKLRVGYGVTGVIPGNSYISQRLYTYDLYGDVLGPDGSWTKTLQATQNPNPNLKWETTNEINFGLDYAVLGGRLSGSFDYYVKTTKDLLYDYAVPVPPNLFPTTTANVGEMKNKGYEVMIEGKPFAGDFSWTTTLTMSGYKNELVSLSNDLYVTDNFKEEGGLGEPISTPTHYMEVGSPLGEFWGLKSVGVDKDGFVLVEVSDGNGGWTVKPFNANLNVQENRQKLGSGLPKMILGWGNTFSYKGFDLSLQFTGQFGYKILNAQRCYYENNSSSYNRLKSAADTYGAVAYNKETKQLEPVLDANGNQLQVTLSKSMSQGFWSDHLEKGDFLKLSNVTLGYKIPIAGIVKNYINSARVFVSASNVFCITGYSGIDPEVSNYFLAPGIDYQDKYPTTRSFSFGLTVNF